MFFLFFLCINFYKLPKRAHFPTHVIINHQPYNRIIIPPTSLSEQVLQSPFANGIPKPSRPGREAHQVHSELHAEGVTDREGCSADREPVPRRHEQVRQGN